VWIKLSVPDFIQPNARCQHVTGASWRKGWIMAGEIKMPMRGNSATQKNVSIERATFAGEELLKWLKKSPDEAGRFIRIALDELQSIAAETEVDSLDLIDRLAARIYSPQTKPDEPKPRFWVANKLICTPGNLTAISAAPKAGKSAAIGAMIASTFAGSGADCLGFVSENPDGFALVHLDTEQCRFDHWEGIQRAVRRAKMDAAPSWLRSYCLTGFTAADVRAAIPILIKQAAKQFGGIHSVFIDGIADVVPDVNDAEETSSLITDLHKWAIEFDCPILNIIHVNPGSDSKTRGHLGSQLERKSETNLKLKQDADGISVIWADKNRRAPIPEKSGSRFAWSDVDKMHVAVQSSESEKDEIEQEQLTELAREVFAGHPPMRYTELNTAVKNRLTVSDKTAERKIKRAVELGIMEKTAEKLYKQKV
jgi:hypothetical protein